METVRVVDYKKEDFYVDVSSLTINQLIELKDEIQNFYASNEIDKIITERCISHHQKQSLKTKSQQKPKKYKNKIKIRRNNYD